MEPSPSPAPAVRPILEWLPPYLATLSRQGHARALHVAKVDEPTVEAARAEHPAFDKACRDILSRRERPQAQARPAVTSPAPATAIDLCRFVGNNHATAIIFRADLDTLSLFCTRLAEAVGLEQIEGQPVVDWFMAERRAMLERQLLAIGDTDPELYEHLQRHLRPVRGHARPGSIVQPPED